MGLCSRLCFAFGYMNRFSRWISVLALWNSVPRLSQRSFKVDSPKRTSIIVMIQNRTTTWFSFQPFNS
jgi:hypothetical protein